MRSTKLGFRDTPVKVKCLRCGYGWECRSKKRTVSCPDCHYPNNVAKAIENAKEKGDCDGD